MEEENISIPECGSFNFGAFVFMVFAGIALIFLAGHANHEREKNELAQFYRTSEGKKAKEIEYKIDQGTYGKGAVFVDKEGRVGIINKVYTGGAIRFAFMDSSIIAPIDVAEFSRQISSIYGIKESGQAAKERAYLLEAFTLKNKLLPDWQKNVR